MRKPTIEEIRKCLDGWGLKDARLKIVSEHNHLIYRVENKEKVYALRMINHESYRKKEWISMGEEYILLKALEEIGSSLGPKVYACDTLFEPPFLIQEFVKATCFNDIKLLSEHLVGAAHAIAELNAQDLRKKLPFLEKYTELGFKKRGLVWSLRLFDSLRRTLRKDLLKWVIKIMPIILQTRQLLSQFEAWFPKDKLFFHFDGAHCGNTYWRDEKVIFLDWQKVSLRNDPTFTLVRFATSTGKEKGVVSEEMFAMLINAYLEIHPIPNFEWLAQARLIERQVSDLVWVLWDYARRGERRLVEEATSVAQRYEGVKKLLESF